MDHHGHVQPRLLEGDLCGRRPAAAAAAARQRDPLQDRGMGHTVCNLHYIMLVVFWARLLTITCGLGGRY